VKWFGVNDQSVLASCVGDHWQLGIALHLRVLHFRLVKKATANLPVEHLGRIISNMLCKRGTCQESHEVSLPFLRRRFMLPAPKLF
jgi:hypothetical protein